MGAFHTTQIQCATFPPQTRRCRVPGLPPLLERGTTVNKPVQVHTSDEGEDGAESMQWLSREPQDIFA